MTRGDLQSSASALTLYPYQRKWFLDRTRFKIGMFARQTGKTFTTSAEIVDSVSEAELDGRRENWLIMSRGERQAKEAMDEGVKKHAKAYQLVTQYHEYEWRGTDGNSTSASYRALEVEFPNGSRVTAVPANPDTARGFSRNVFLDEFAFHQDSRNIWRALFPVISANFKIRVVSTPNGKGNKFYELMTTEDPIWSRHVVDIYQAVKDGLPRDIDALRRGIADDDAWAQEFELKWLDEATAWLPYDLIFSVEHPDAGDPGRYAGGDCFIGNDIAAGGGDLWVAWVWERVGDVLWTREIRTLRRAKFAEHDAVMDELFDTYRVRGLGMDQTGMGEKPVEDAQRRYGAHRVRGVVFSPSSKLMIATTGKAYFEDRKVRIPEGNIALRSDLHSLIKVTGETGNVRFLAPRQGGSHADRTWAGFLGCHVADGGAVEYDCDAAGERVAARVWRDHDAGPQIDLEDERDAIDGDGYGSIAGNNDFRGWA